MEPDQDRTRKRAHNALPGSLRCVEAGGIILRCKHCNSVRFQPVTFQARPLPVLDFLSEGLAYAVPLQVKEGVLRFYACDHCGSLHGFVQVPGTRGPVERPVEEAEDWECLACGGTIAAGLQRCPACGWTYALAEP